MTKRMLVDATQPEEIRVVVVSGNKLEELDFEVASRKQLKGNIYLAKVTRVEPSLQAAFVEYGGNRHGFLAFSEIHPDYYRIPVADREALLAEERRYADFADADDDEPPPVVRQLTAPLALPVSAGAGDSGSDAEAGLAADGDFGQPEGEAPVELAATVAAIAEAIPVEMLTESAADSHDGLATHDAPPPHGDSHSHVEALNFDDAVNHDDAVSHDDALPADDGLTRMFGEGGAANASGASDSAPEAGENTEGREPMESAAAAGPPGAVEPVNLDTVGGDEVEEMVRRRPRPLRSYKIQEVIKRRQILLVQVTKEERGSKGAALTTYLSLPGRYCVLMPNTGRGGGVSRKITNPQDRKRLKEMLSDLDVPQGMAVILRTAGMERTKPEIKRDLEYLLRLWDSIREQTLKSTAPELIYEEANLIKRSIRDLYTNDIDDLFVEGENGYRVAKDFMRMLVPSHAKRVQPYRDESIPLFVRYQVETQIDAIHSPVVQLRSGGYIVINPTEALVAIDVNSGRSTRERNIEETAYKTNLEAAEEIARQLRLRDLAGLIVIDFIDMEDNRNVASVERKLKEAMKTDRARIQLGRISPFGLLELSRQRMRPSLMETNFERCPHCAGAGVIRSVESASLHTLRALEEEGIRRRTSEVSVAVASKVALYILNAKRVELARIEQRYGMRVQVLADDTLLIPDLRIERLKVRAPGEELIPAITSERIYAESALAAGDDPDDEAVEAGDEAEDETERLDEAESAAQPGEAAGGEDGRGRRGNGGRRNRRGRRRPGGAERGSERGGERGGERGSPPESTESGASQVSAPQQRDRAAGDEGEVDDGEEGGDDGEQMVAETAAGDAGDALARKRRRGRRGGRRRGRGRFDQPANEAQAVGAGDEGPADGQAVATGTEAGLAAAMAEAPGSMMAPLDDVTDFDWFLDGGERSDSLSAGPAEPLPMASIEAAEAAVGSTEGDSEAFALVEAPAEIADGGEGTEAESVEGGGDGAAESAGPAQAAGETGPRKRTRRRAGSDDPADPEAAARRSRRRVKMASTGETAAALEIAAEVAPEAAAEIVPEPVSTLGPDVELASGLASELVDGIAESSDGAVIAPTERLEAVPPAAPVIVADAPLPTPTRESVDSGDVPVEPKVSRTGWWRK